jgi:AcrR family transcriptional regulator
MELRERIIERTTILFFRNGIKSMTMSDIANEVGISKRTLYEIFRDKEDLLESCINEHKKRADREIAVLINNSENVIDTLMRVYAKQLNNMWNVGRSIVHDMKKYHRELYNRIECRQREDMYIFIPLFDKGVEQGLIRNDTPFEILMWLLKRQFRFLLEDEIIPTDKYSLDEFIRAIILNFTRGISTPLGIKRIDEIIKNENSKKKIN